MIKERKKQYNANGTCVKSRARFNDNNPCECVCNLYHLEYDGSEVFTVCNSCEKDIAIIEKNQAKELLKQVSWRW